MPIRPLRRIHARLFAAPAKRGSRRSGQAVGAIDNQPFQMGYTGVSGFLGACTGSRNSSFEWESTMSSRIWVKMRGIFTSGVSALLLTVLLLAPAAFAAPVLNLSDVHFDPFADPSLVNELAAAPAVEWESILLRSGSAVATWGEETNAALLDSALGAMRAASPQPALMFFTGDVLAHKFEEKYLDYTGDDSRAGLRSFIYKTMDYVISKVADAFPGVPIYYILGNNDAYDGDYAVAPEGAFLSDMGELLADRFLQSQDDRLQFLPTFTQGGYYSLALPGDSPTRVIGLNSTFFSVEYDEPDETSPGYDPAWQELGWLEDQLETARAQGERVWLLSHIPPGVHAHKAVNESATPFPT